MVHTVQRGETLIRIAHKYGVSVEAIQRANPIIKSINKIEVGWKLTIPGEKDYAKIGKAFQKAMEDVEKLDSVKELLSLME